MTLNRIKRLERIDGYSNLEYSDMNFCTFVCLLTVFDRENDLVVYKCLSHGFISQLFGKYCIKEYHYGSRLPYHTQITLIQLIWALCRSNHIQTGVNVNKLQLFNMYNPLFQEL